MGNEDYINKKEYVKFRKHIKEAYNLFVDSGLADVKTFGECIDRFGEACKSIAMEIDCKE